MAQVIKIADIANGMNGFVTYFEANLLKLEEATKDKLDTAYRILYSKPRNGGSCSSCLVNVYHQLNDIYIANKPSVTQVVETIKIETTTPVTEDKTLSYKKKK